MTEGPFFYELVIDDMDGGQYPSITTVWQTDRKLTDEEWADVRRLVWAAVDETESFSSVSTNAEKVLKDNGFRPLDLKGGLELSCNADPRTL